NAGMALHWFVKAHSFLYVTRCASRMQIVNHRGWAVLDGEVREGQAVVVPQNFAVVKRASEQGCEWAQCKEESKKSYRMVVFSRMRFFAMSGWLHQPRGLRYFHAKTNGKGADGSWLWCTTDDNLYEVVKSMTQHNVGALVVVKPGEKKSIARIITERDCTFGNRVAITNFKHGRGPLKTNSVPIELIQHRSAGLEGDLGGGVWEGVAAGLYGVVLGTAHGEEKVLIEVFLQMPKNDKWSNMSVMANGWGSRERGRLALKRIYLTPKHGESSMLLTRILGGCSER
ncbi:CBS domain-containing protein, partial [Striga asiatica]